MIRFEKMSAAVHDLTHLRRQYALEHDAGVAALLGLTYQFALSLSPSHTAACKTRALSSLLTYRATNTTSPHGQADTFATEMLMEMVSKRKELVLELCWLSNAASLVPPRAGTPTTRASELLASCIHAYSTDSSQLSDSYAEIISSDLFSNTLSHMLISTS
jgi:hypothetical protein